MSDTKPNSFMQSVKGKIVIVFLIACFSLFLAWGISKIAFNEMMVAVENISAPNDKLRIVNELSRKVGQLDQFQKTQILNNPDKYYNFFRQSNKLNLTIDTLKSLYAGDSAQLSRIVSLKKLLRDRDRLFINYLKVRERLVNNKAFSAQIQSLNLLADKNAKQTDSAVTTTEKKTSTTIIYPDKQKDTRSFLSKLFGTKKKQPQNDEAYKIVSEETNIQRDTVAQAIKDSILHSMTEAMQKIEKNQRRKSAQFINRETTLTRANNELIGQILTILKQVENEAVAQIEVNNGHAKDVVNASVKRISLIMLAFFLVTVILLYFILTDISRSNRYRNQLEQARDAAEYHSMAKQRFLSNMSHEIRTPLQSIIGYAELISQQEHPRKKDIEAIYQSSGHLMQIVNEVLDYNRIISGKFTFTNRVFNITALLDEVVSVMSLQAAKKSLKMVTNYSPTTNIQVEGDPFRLKQVLYNLLGNAIKFTHAGQITLTASCLKQDDTAYFTFSIKDTGIGLTEADTGKIFNEFEQVDNADTNSQTGTGLGLTISKELIESQGGNIYVESKPGKGSTFTFRLQFTIVTDVVDEISDTIEALLIKDTNTWIVDDDSFILELCSLLLTKHHIQHRCFNSPAKLLGTDWDDTVKYVFLDIRMPEMNGMELCAILRKKIPAHVKIYALTAQVMPQESETILQAGFDGILLKPFKEHDILALYNKPAQVEDPAKNEAVLDITALTKMTFGDKAQLEKILEQFIEDSFNDIIELKKHLEDDTTERTDEIVLLVHRMAGRTAQIGSKELAADLRRAEMELHSHSTIDQKKANLLFSLIIRLQSLRAFIKEEYLYTEAEL